MPLVVLSEKCIFDTEDILYIGMPVKRFVNSTTDDRMEFKIALKNGTLVTNIEVQMPDVTKERLYQIHENIVKEWKNTRDLVAI